MALKKHGRYNDFDPASLPELPEKGTIVTFEYVHKYTDPIPKPGTYQIRTTYRYSQKIPPISSFYCPKKEDWTLVGLVYGVDQNGEPRNVKRIIKFPQQDFGRLTITIGNSAEEDDLYQYLMMCSFVEGNTNTNRDENEEILLRYVDAEKSAAALEKEYNTKLESMQLALSLNDEQAVDTAYLLGFDASLTPKRLRMDIAKHAENNAADFLAIMRDEDATYIALINRALAAGVVELDAPNKLLRWANSPGVVCEIANPVASEIGRQFVGYIKGEKNPEAIIKTIKMQIDNKERANRKPKKVK